MLGVLWLKGIGTRRTGRLFGAALGVALTVALIAVLGAFLASSAAVMTQRAVAGVPVDWQIQLVPGADVGGVTAAVNETTPSAALLPIGFADVTGFQATSGGTVQTTGAGKVLGMSAQYRQQFAAELRLLVGSPDGVLVAQQTAANLHVTVGDQVIIQRTGLPPSTVRVGGIVDLPYADSLFQAVGAPPGAAPQAPPDNILLLPDQQWHQLFDPQAAVRPDSVRTQLHVRIAAALPADPNAAYTTVQQLAHHVEARIAGSGIVGDNLAARLDGARADALYAKVLFLFLGLPGAILAVLLTLAVAAAGADRRRREQALLRTRGASTAQLLRLAGLEAVLVAIVGVALGLAFAVVAAQTIVSTVVLAGSTALLWMLIAAVIGLLLAAVAVLFPAWTAARQSTVAAARSVIGRRRQPWWQRLYLDVITLVIATIAFWQTAGSGYQVVMAPEGVAQSSVAYQAFLAPVGLWLGLCLLAVRLSNGGLQHGRRQLAGLLRPLARGLAGVVSASLGRQRLLVTRGVVLVALAVSFATATAVFDTTYTAQARVDAQLTNGADVTVTGTAAAPASSRLTELRSVPGVVAAQPMQHRFAYVGNDLQDLYGIDPAHIGAATAMSNAYFAGGNAQATLHALASHPDGVLVSAETMRDYQLRPGDQVKLRLQSAQDHQYHVVPFHFLGIVREFPTAPKDSFLVANAGYIAQHTGASAAEIVLLRVSGDPVAVATRVRALVQSLPGVKVSDLTATQQIIGSNLTAVNLHGLTRLELGFAIVLAAGATGLILGLGLAERRRTFAILGALGATAQQLGAFLWSEGLLILVGGGLVGLVAGFGVAQVLVVVLTGVFDPPPEALAVPWAYLVLLIAAATTATVVAVLAAQATSCRPTVAMLREL